MEFAFHGVLLLVLLMISGFFSATETALFSLSKVEKRRLLEKHPHAGRWVHYHLEHPRRTLITILIGNLLVNTLSAAVAALMALHFLGPRGLTPAMIGYTLVLIVFCEITPKVFAVRQNESFSLLMAFPLHVFAIAIYPVRRLTRWISDGMLSMIIHEKREHPDRISEEELKTLVKIGEEEGVLDRQERRMIQKLLELGERPVKAIMTPRIDVIALDVEESHDKQLAILKRYHFSHLPVYEGTIDHILGIISIQDYMLSAAHQLRPLIEQPLFIPETKLIDDLLSEFRKKNLSFAVCVDEYGGTAGIVTLEDILEEIFGEYHDEYAKVENPIRSFGHHEYIVEAKIPLSEFNDYFSTQLEAKDATTLAGYILETTGEVPEKGKLLETPELDIRIHDVIRNRIRSVLVKRR